MIRIGIAIVALLVVAAGIGFYLWVYPTIAPPPEPLEVIEARWAKVDEWARVDTYQGDPAALTRALEHLAKSGVSSHRVNDGPLTDERLDPPARAALLELVNWAEDGGLGPERCIGGFRRQTLPGLQLFALTQVALASADDPDAPEVAATLRLGDALRDRGDLLQSSVGFQVATVARELAEQRSWPLGQAFIDYRPRREQVFPAVAREPFCTDVEIRALVREGGDPGVEIDEAMMSRELAMYRWYHGVALAALEAHRGDLRALARAAEEPPEPPKSLLLQAASVGYSMLGSHEDEIAAYDRFLKRAAPAT